MTNLVQADAPHGSFFHGDPQTFDNSSVRQRKDAAILSCIAHDWAPGQVVEPTHSKHITNVCHSENCHRDAPHCDNCHASSEQMSFGHWNFVENEAFEVLVQRVTIRTAGCDKTLSLDSMSVIPFRNHAFTLKNPMSNDCEAEYNGSFEDDILLKVYLLNQRYQKDDYARYALQGYIHAMLKPRLSVLVPAGCYLGLVLHRNLNRDWLFKLKEQDHPKYLDYINRSTIGGHEGREDPLGEQTAVGTDYLISFSSGNKHQHDALLHNFCIEPVQGPHGTRPITFCTDRSLGFGGHFNLLEGLYLGKHGFGQPIVQGGWWEEYARAAAETEHGVLIVNPSPEYFQSIACRKEDFGIPSDRKWCFVRDTRRILSHQEYCQHVDDSRSGLAKAASQGEVHTARALLLESAKSIHDVNANGLTALHVSARAGHLSIAKLLLDANADAEARNFRGSTAIQTAAGHGHTEVVQALLCLRADIKEALHFAVGRNHVQVAELLLSVGAKLDERNTNGDTALDVAQRYDMRTAIYFLHQWSHVSPPSP